MALLVAVVLVDKIDLNVADLTARAQVILAHQSIEVDRGGGACVGLVIGHLGYGGQVIAEFVENAAVCSTGVPAGMSTITWNSDLLSNGSIFSCTQSDRREHERNGDQRCDTQSQQSAVALAAGVIE